MYVISREELDEYRKTLPRADYDKMNGNEFAEILLWDRQKIVEMVQNMDSDT